MRAGDMPAVYAVQCAAYPPSHHELAAVLLSHWQAAPDCCFVAEGADGPCGYVFGHPWAGRPPRLHEPLPVCAAPDHLFVHDLAVHPAVMGRGVAAALLASLEGARAMRGLAAVRLVAVGAAAPFWRRQGFLESAEQGVDPRYGPALLMERRSLATA